MPFFSIIIPTYNRAAFIATTIHSALAQKFQDVEILIIDDGSTDNTQQVVAGFTDPRIKYYRKKNNERGAARNTGISVAEGEYITFIDSDDLLYEHHLTVARQFIDQHASPEVFHIGYEIKSPEGKVITRYNNLSDINSLILKGNPLSCLGVFVRQDVMRKNPFNEDRQLAGLEDWELWLRLAARFRILNSNTITAAMINHSSRSVLEIDPEKLKKKAKLFIEYVYRDAQNVRAFGKKLKKVSASIKTYVALHLAIARQKRKDILTYLLAGIIENPGEVFRKRFYVILKLLLKG